MHGTTNVKFRPMCCHTLLQSARNVIYILTVLDEADSGCSVC